MTRKSVPLTFSMVGILVGILACFYREVLTSPFFVGSAATVGLVSVGTYLGIKMSATHITIGFWRGACAGAVLAAGFVAAELTVFAFHDVPPQVLGWVAPVLEGIVASAAVLALWILTRRWDWQISATLVISYVVFAATPKRISDRIPDALLLVVLPLICAWFFFLAGLWISTAAGNIPAAGSKGASA